MNLKWIFLSVIIVPNLGGMGFESQNGKFLSLDTEKLFKGVKENNPKKVYQAIEDGGNINAIDKEGMIPVAHAIKNSSSNIAEILLNHPNIRIKDWRHPETKEDLVAFANRCIQPNLVQYINDAIKLEEKALNAIKMPYKNWNNELFKAAQQGNIALAKEAIENGAKINEINNEGYTALIKAIINKKEDLAILLVNHPGIDVTSWVHPITGAHTLDVAAQFKMVKLGQTILNKMDRDERASENVLPAEPAVPDEDISINKGFSNIAREFFNIERSYASHNLAERYKKFSSPLAGSSKWQGDRPEHLVNLSLISDAAIAIVSKNKELLIDILNQGITPMDITVENITLLQVAQNDSNKEIIEILEKFQDKENKTERRDLEQANKNASGKILDKLIDQILHTIDTKNPGELENLLEGCNIQKVDEEINKKKKMSLLFYALKICPTRGIIKVLLDKEVNVNGTDANGRTPLMHAAVYNSDEIVELLCNANADMAAKTSLGLTACDMAQQNKRGDIANLIQVFIASKKN